MRTNLSYCVLAGLGLALASQAQAATVTGSISSTLTLTAACQVNGTSGTSGLNFGALNFGTQDALFVTANAQVLGGGGRHEHPVLGRYGARDQSACRPA